MKIISRMPEEKGSLDLVEARLELGKILKFLRYYKLSGFGDGEFFADPSISNERLSFGDLSGRLDSIEVYLKSSEFIVLLEELRHSVTVLLAMAKKSVDDPDCLVNLMVGIPSNNSLINLFHMDSSGCIATMKLDELDSYTPTEFLIGTAVFDENRKIRRFLRRSSEAIKEGGEIVAREFTSRDIREDLKRYISCMDPGLYEIQPSVEGVFYHLGGEFLCDIAPEVNEMVANIHRRAFHSGEYRAIFEVDEDFEM